MLTPQEGSFDRVRLIDFGIARVDESTLAPKTEISRAIGTVRYISPEQLAGNLYLGPAADIYSVAVVAYEMLTGQLPFRPETMIHMYRLQQDGLKTTPRELRPEIPAEAEKILLSGLEFDAEKRPQNARTFGRDLARSLRAARLAPLYETEDLSTYRTELAGDEVVTALRTGGLNTSNSQDQKSGLPLKWIAAAVLSFAVLTAVASVVLWNVIGQSPTAAIPTNGANTPPIDRAPEREISYHMVTQKMSGKTTKVGEPRRWAGQSFAVEAGTKIFFAFKAEADGYFYLWNVGMSDGGSIAYYALFPLETVNGGSSRAGAGEEIKTLSNTFQGTGGTEAFYLVWSERQLEKLETIYQSRPKNIYEFDRSGDIAVLRSFQRIYEDEKPALTVDEAVKTVRIKSKKDVIVHRFTVELE